MRYLLPVLFILTGCTMGGDQISLRNAREARDTIERDLDPKLPESYRNAAKGQAKAWVEYEEAKLGGGK